MINRRTMLARLGLLAGGAAAWPARTAAAAPLAPVLAGHPAYIVNYLPHMVALTQQYMREEGLDFRLMSSDGGTKLRDIVAGGQVSFGLGDSTHPIQLANRGRPAKILLAIDRRCPYTNVVVRSDLYEKGITTLQALADYRRPDRARPIVAVATLGGGQYVYASYLFEQIGAANKLNLVSGGVTLTMLGGLRSGQFDAIVAPAAWQIEAERGGFGKTIFDVSDDASWNRYFGGPLPVTCAYALQSTIDRYPQLVQAYVNGMVRALHWIRRSSSAQIWQEVGVRQLRETRADTAVLELDAFKRTASYDGETDAAAFANGAPIWFRPGTGIKPIRYADVTDLSFLHLSRRKYG